MYAQRSTSATRSGNAPQPGRPGVGGRIPTPAVQTSAQRMPRHRPDAFGAQKALSPPMNSQNRQTGIPRYGTRGPSPALSAPTDAYLTSSQSPRSMMSRPSTTSPQVGMPRELKRKQSRNVLRRKPSSIGTTSSLPEVSRASSSPFQFAPLPSSQSDGQTPVYETPPRTNLPFTTYEPPIIPELDRYRSVADPAIFFEDKAAAAFPPGLITDLSPPTPLGFAGNHYRLSQYSGYSSSARCSESPGPSAYSRDTTPTSISSQSPSAIALPVKGARIRQPSPTTHSRPPVVRRRGGTPNLDDGAPFEAQGLPSLRESVTSYSSNSTLRDGDKSQVAAKNRKKKLTPPPPSPPPRKSSAKHTKSPGEEKPSPAKSASPSAKSRTMASPSISSITDSPQRSIGTPGRTPRRPSRDGTPDLPQGLVEPFVVQSNLASITTSPSRPELPRNGSSSSLIRSRPQGQSQSRATSRGASQSPTRQTQRGVSPAPAGLGIVPILQPQGQSQSVPGKSVTTPSPTTKSRFGFFRRRLNSNEQTKAEKPEKPEKLQRKGPAAGTGHEGYARYGLRGRSGSTSGTTSRETSATRGNTSQETLANGKTQDTFLKDRMSPVVIIGGGGKVSSELTRSESSQSIVEPTGRLNESKENLSRVTSAKDSEADRITLWPSPLVRPLGNNSSAPHIPLQPSLMSDGSDSEVVQRPTLAYRRSIQRLKSADAAIPMSLPRPINTTGAASRPVLTSNDTSILSDDSRPDITDLRKNAKKLVPPRKLAKRRPSSPMKWNPFKRGQSAPPKKNEEEDDEELSVILGQPSAKSQAAVAHYALIDPMDTYNEPEKLGLEDLNAILKEAKDLTIENEIAQHLAQELQNNNTSITGHRLSGSSLRPLVLVESNKAMNQAQQRPSRLAQVGRIPQVKSSIVQGSPVSFSRPFTDRNVPQQERTSEEQEELTILPGPTEVSNDPGSKESPLRHDRPFFVIVPRKDSQGTSSSSSGGGAEWVNTTAVIPEPNAELGEDEVWGEYDDLVGGANNVPQSAISITSSQGFPFQFEHYVSPQESKPLQVQEPETKEQIAREMSDASLGTKIKQALGGLVTPDTPGSFSDILAGYTERHGGLRRNSSKASRHHSFKSGSSGHSRKSLIEITAQVSNSPLAEVNLRVASMNIAKWLTFSNVLFSPARDQILQTEGSTVNSHSILVVDGLGNDDWSFYLSETYPAVTFYNLSPTPASPSTGSQVTSSLSMPSNHRQVQYLRSTDKFPFPSSHFTAVIVRFPAAGSEAAYRNLINESKRVLRPAGYLELSILDLDMNNMGVRTRRLIRELKVKMSVAQPDISLAPASDTVLRLLGRRGFRDVKSCRLGVPVAGLVSENKKGGDSKAPRAEEDVGIMDMMKDDSSAGDESITKMVAKVGRWWYTQCYEQMVLSNGDVSQSMWQDEKLLDECQRWGTGFKLLVCYAQKPIVARRRTLSA